MKTYHEIMQDFYALALRENYLEKVVGDYAFRQPSTGGKYKYIRLKGFKDGKIKIVRFEQ